MSCSGTQSYGIQQTGASPQTGTLTTSETIVVTGTSTHLSTIVVTGTSTTRFFIVVTGLLTTWSAYVMTGWTGGAQMGNLQPP